jgi:hypothetical protein
VIRAGYTAFYEVLSSDHRGLFIDIDAQRFYITKNPDSTCPTASRLLKSTDRRAVAKYNKYVKEHLANYQEILTDIEANAQSPDEAKARYDTIDDKLGEIMEAAELDCAKPRRESLWSKRLQAAELLVRYWKARRSQLTAKKSLVQALQTFRNEFADLLPPTRAAEEDDNRDDEEESEARRSRSSGHVEDNGTVTRAYIKAQMCKAIAHLTHIRKNDAANR